MKDKLLRSVLPFILIISMVILCLPVVPAYADTHYVLPPVPDDIYSDYGNVFVYERISDGVIHLFTAEKMWATSNGLGILHFYEYIYDVDNHSWVLYDDGSTSSTSYTQSSSKYYNYLYDTTGTLILCDTVSIEFDTGNKVTLPAGQWECNTSPLTGEYYHLSAWPNGVETESFDFHSGGVAFSEMSYRYDVEVANGYALYYGEKLAYSYGLSNTGFDNDVYGQIFLASDQYVSPEFYNWFTANFTYLSADQELPTFETVINIYNSSGSELLDSYSLSGESYSPIVDVSIIELGLQISDGSGDVWTWATDADVFYGFSLNPNSVTVAYGSGSSFIAGGYYSDFVLDLYLTMPNNDQTDEKEYDSNVLGWLERIYDNFREFLVGIWERLAPSKSENLIKIIDFSIITEIFADAYDSIFDFFGLQDLIDNDEGPFSWLRE